MRGKWLLETLTVCELVRRHFESRLFKGGITMSSPFEHTKRRVIRRLCREDCGWEFDLYHISEERRDCQYPDTHI